jgi:hypothetical protein
MQGIFPRWFVNVAWTVITPFPQLPAQANNADVSSGIATQTGSVLQITVSVYNSAQVSMRDLAEAEAQAASIFQKSGIKVTWVTGLMVREVNQPSASGTWTAAHVHLRIWTRSMARPKVIGSDVLGFCISMEKG